MAKTLNNPPFPRMERVKQENDFYCGPAVIQMLFSFVGIKIKQEEVLGAAGIGKKIKTEGIAVEEMARAVKKVTQDYSFWYKRYSTLSELSKIVNVFKYPVGVEWQGLFDYEEEEEEESEGEKDTDPGHYSVVTAIDTRKNLVLIADPFRAYAGKDRKFTVVEFDRRWWDINEVIDLVKKKQKEVDDYHMMFVIAPKVELFPEKLEMTRG